MFPLVGRKPHSVPVSLDFSYTFKGSIGPEQQPDSFLLVSLHDWLQNLPPPLSAVDVPGEALHLRNPEMVEQKSG